MAGGEDIIAQGVLQAVFGEALGSGGMDCF